MVQAAGWRLWASLGAEGSLVSRRCQPVSAASSSMVIRDLTLRSAASFSAPSTSSGCSMTSTCSTWWSTGSPRPLGETPIAVMGEVSVPTPTLGQEGRPRGPRGHIEGASGWERVIAPVGLTQADPGSCHLL